MTDPARLRDTGIPPDEPLVVAALGIAAPPFGRPGAVLRVTSENSESPKVCCGYCSGQMAARTVKPSLDDNMRTGAAHAARAAAGRPHNAGSNADEIEAGIRAVTGVVLVECSTADAPALLKAGRAVVYSCDYDQLPSYVKVQGGAFGHSVCLFGWNDSSGGLVGFYDPLYAQDSDGMWARWTDVAPAGWAGLAHSATIGDQSMKLTDVKPASGTATMTADGRVFRVADGAQVDVNAGASWTVAGSCRFPPPSGDPAVAGYMIRARAADGELHVVSQSRVTFKATAPADCSAERARITTIKGKVAALAADVAND